MAVGWVRSVVRLTATRKYSLRKHLSQRGPGTEQKANMSNGTRTDLPAKTASTNGI